MVSSIGPESTSSLASPSSISALSFAEFAIREQVYGRSVPLGSEACRKFEVTDVIESDLPLIVRLSNK